MTKISKKMDFVNLSGKNYWALEGIYTDDLIIVERRGNRVTYTGCTSVKDGEIDWDALCEHLFPTCTEFPESEEYYYFIYSVICRYNDGEMDDKMIEFINSIEDIEEQREVIARVGRPYDELVYADGEWQEVYE